MHEQTTAPLVVDTRTAAELLGVTPQTLEVWRVQGVGPPFVKLGNGGRTAPVRYRVEVLKEYLCERERRSTSDTRRLRKVVAR